MMKLYVGNLSWNTDEAGLREAFERFGDIEFARVITDRETGRSRGFGFVTFHHREDALNAIEGMDGQDLDGRPLKVNEVRERNDRRNQGSWSPM